MIFVEASESGNFMNRDQLLYHTKALLTAYS